jgi:ABC-type multidrug transport system fused ATPase/permease subunit
MGKSSKNRSFFVHGMMHNTRKLYRYVKLHPGETGSVLILVAGIILFVATSALLFWYMKWSWIGYGILQGVFFGFIVGAIVIENVSPNKQIAAIGAVTGMTLDLAVSLQQNSPGTAITALAKLISSIVNALHQAAAETGVPPPEDLAITWGLWVFIILVGIIMIIGRVTSKYKKREKAEVEPDTKVVEI